MIKLMIPFAFLTLMTASSCEVTINEGSSDKEEPKDGFKYGKRVSTINGVFSIKNGELVAGENLIVEFKDVENATLKDGYQHVGIAVRIKDADGNVLDEVEDLISNVEQQDPDYNEYFAYYGVPTGVEDGEKVTLEFTLFDKYGDVSYDFTDEYTIVHKSVPGTEGVKMNTDVQGLNLSAQIFKGRFQYEKAPIEVSEEDEIVMYFGGVNGFTEIEGVVSMNYSIALLDAEGNETYFLEDALSGEVEGMTSYPVNFSQTFLGVPAGNYTWDVKLSDANSTKHVTSTVDVVVQ